MQPKGTFGTFEQIDLTDVSPKQRSWEQYFSKHSGKNLDRNYLEQLQRDGEHPPNRAILQATIPKKEKHDPDHSEREHVIKQEQERRDRERQGQEQERKARERQEQEREKERHSRLWTQYYQRHSKANLDRLELERLRISGSYPPDHAVLLREVPKVRNVTDFKVGELRDWEKKWADYRSKIKAVGDKLTDWVHIERLQERGELPPTDRNGYTYTRIKRESGSEMDYSPDERETTGPRGAVMEAGSDPSQTGRVEEKHAEPTDIKSEHDIKSEPDIKLEHDIKDEQDPPRPRSRGRSSRKRSPRRSPRKRPPRFQSRFAIRGGKGMKRKKILRRMLLIRLRNGVTNKIEQYVG